jgi:threonine/homoserine/homoserine lactone efflux protein
VSAVVASAPLWQRLLILVPAFVIGGGLVVAVLILLGRAMAQTVRESQHPRWFYIGFVVLAGVVALLTYLGVKLPREG